MSERVFFEFNPLRRDSLHYVVSVDSNDRKPEELRVLAMDALTLVVDSVESSELKPVSEAEVAKLSLEGVPVTHHGAKVYLVTSLPPRQMP